MALPHGIDLGTTRSAVARVNAYGRAELVDNSLGERLTPSAVWCSPDDIMVGKHARDMAGAYPDQVTQFFKRHMGDGSWTFKDASGGQHSAIELSAHVLRALNADVHRATNEALNEVVIAVPAYFGHAARTATYEAAALAGLTAIDLINEPTAAVLAWMLDSGQRPQQGLLVYDLGGGTFDSVAVRQIDDVLEVVTIGGDNVLGGHDWDRALTLEFNEQFQRANQTRVTPTADSRTDNAWLERAEFAKVFLASNPRAKDVQVVLRHDQWVTPVVVTRDMYDRVTKGLRDRTLLATMWVLHHAKEKVGLQPNSVLLAGGMSRLPAITDMLFEKLGLTPVAMSRPDYMVAEGAALWALKRSAERKLATTDAEVVARYLIQEHGLPDAFANTLSRLKIQHVTSRGFAIQYRDRESKRPKLEFLALAQQVLPISATWSGVTPTDDVTTLEVAVFEQNGHRETTDPRHHLKLGAAVMEGIPKGYPSQTPVEVTFVLDMDQVIRVSFTHPGKEQAAEAQIYVGAPAGVGELKTDRP